MADSLIALNIESCDIFDADCVREIENITTIKIIAKNEYDEIIVVKNIIYLLTKILRMKIILLTDYWTRQNFYDNDWDDYKLTNSLNDLCYEESDSKNKAIIIYNFILSNDEHNELCSKFGKIIYPFHDMQNDNLNTISDLTFAYLPIEENQSYHNFSKLCDEKLSFEYFNKMYNACINDDDMLMIKNNSIKICKIERPNTYIKYYHQYSRVMILQTIETISHDRSIFYPRSNKLYELLWKKYHFLTKCFCIWLQITGFVEHSKDALGMIIRFMINLFDDDKENHINQWLSPSLLHSAYNINIMYLAGGMATLRYSS